MTTLKPVIFFGTEQFSVPSLEALIREGYSVLAVVTKPDSPKGRGRVASPPAVKSIAEQHKIPVLQPHKLDNTFIEHLSRIKDKSGHDAVTGVLVAYGKIIPQSVIDLFSPGIINVHPSLLPKYRGPSPIESALLNGDEQTGISIMSLAKEMDAGPVYTQEIVALDSTETRPTLYTQLAEKGAQFLIETLPAILDGSLEPIAQDAEHATYCSLLTKEDSLLDTEHKNAVQLERQIRAYRGFPKSRVQLLESWVIVTKAHVMQQNESDAALPIGCYGNTTLVIDELIAPSGKTVSADAYLRGLRTD